jgi:hypothetical protein
MKRCVPGCGTRPAAAAGDRGTGASCARGPSAPPRGRGTERAFPLAARIFPWQLEHQALTHAAH